MGKNIFATITYVAEKIVEAITGHNSKVDAHPSLVEQINVLSGSKVDKMTFQRDINIDTFYKEGSHRIFNATGKLPSDITQGENDIVLTCYPLSDGTSFIRKTLLNIRSNKMYLYSKRSDIAYDWEEIATTTKTDILVVPKQGFTISRNRSYTFNGILFIDINVQKTDNSAIPIGSLFLPFSLPTTHQTPLTCVVLSGNGSVLGNATAINGSDSNVYILNNISSARQLDISGVIRL